MVRHRLFPLRRLRSCNTNRAGLWAGVVAASALVASCGGSSPRAEPARPAAALPDAWDLEAVPARPRAAAPVETEPAGPVPVPSECGAPNGAVCTPPPEFVAKLCEGAQPNVALTLFRKGTPWTRAYVRVAKVEAWYASGARSRPAELGFAEELIVLADRSAGAGGMVVSGSGSYDVLRWDGTCVSVMSDEISLRSPGNPDVAPIEWTRLDEDIQTALERDQKISTRNGNRREQCKDNGPGSDTRCQRAKIGLARLIASYVREGGDVPVRTHLR